MTKTTLKMLGLGVAALALLVVLPSANALSASAGTGTSCPSHEHFGITYYVPVASYQATATLTLADLAGQAHASGSGMNVPAQTDATAWPLKNTAHVEASSTDYVVAPVPPGTVVWATAEAGGNAATHLTPITAYSKSQYTCGAGGSSGGGGGQGSHRLVTLTATFNYVDLSGFDISPDDLAGWVKVNRVTAVVDWHQSDSLA